jgi:hypothetical protein
MLLGQVCEHIRFYKKQLAFYKVKTFGENICIYCYSEKKINPSITLICNYRDHNDEENHQILNFLEKNEIPFKVYDYENSNFISDNNKNLNKNLKKLIEKAENFLLIDEEERPYSVLSLENKQNGVNRKDKTQVRCKGCWKSFVSDSKQEKCYECLIKEKSLFSENLQNYNNNKNNSNKTKSNTNNSNNLSIYKKNPYNFIEKLQLSKRYINCSVSPIKAVKTKKIFNSSFQDSEVNPKSPSFS